MASTVTHLIKLARPRQWVKGAFVAVGPAYAVAKNDTQLSTGLVVGTLAAVLAFGFASSSCYIVNDIRDREADRAHPRKRRRPIASGAISVSLASRFSGFLLLLAVASVFLALAGVAPESGDHPLTRALWLGLALVCYVVNTTLYSVRFKHIVVLDVISLATGFVLRVLAGCAATGVTPTSMLLNVTFFLSMFLAFGKRLGERRTMGGDASVARSVQGVYTDELLRMAVVVTGVATLVTYAGYVDQQAQRYEHGFNLLWLTMLPATYGLMRCIVLLERGAYDDPTELASRDRPMQAAAILFGVLTASIMFYGRFMA